MDDSDGPTIVSFRRFIDLSTHPHEQPTQIDTERESLAVRSLVDKYKKEQPEGDKKVSKSRPQSKDCKETSRIDTSCSGTDIAQPSERKPLARRVRLRKQREKATKFRLKRKTSKILSKKIDDGLFNSLIKAIAQGARGKRRYTRTRVELIARVGSSPSEGGSRAPLAGIIKHVTGGWCTLYICISVQLIK